MLIAHGIKDIENRTWRTTHRGRIHIHLSAKSAGVPLLLLTDQQIIATKDYSFKDDYIKSAIVGEVEIADCVIGHQSIWAETADPGDKPMWNWVLENAVLYDRPIENVKGALSLWEYSKP